MLCALLTLHNRIMKCLWFQCRWVFCVKLCYFRGFIRQEKAEFVGGEWWGYGVCAATVFDAFICGGKVDFVIHGFSL